MNKKVIVVLILTVAGLVFLALISFGPLKNLRKQTGINPISYKPTQQVPGEISGSKNSSTKNQSFISDVYKNIDVKENYYQISIPQEWQTIVGEEPGSYRINFSGGDGLIKLMDVPDNTTLELFVLSQEEPRLKREAKNYQRLDYQKTDINGNFAYELTYISKIDQKELKTISVYITGPDHAGVITLSATAADFENVQPIFDKLIQSFNWQNK